jgi:predicted metal-dependent enzyme (double-stranded beta helix superfamily)
MGSETVERLIEACRTAIAAGEGQGAIRELVAATVSEPAALASALGEPEHAGLETLYRASDLTVLHFAWAPWMCFKPHNHNMWAVVGILTGREDNIFWRRAGDRIEAAGARSLGVRDVTVLGPDIIHSVTNPVGKMTRAIHVYGGDFFAPVQPRSEWDTETLVERPLDMEDTRRRFAEAEARFRAVRSD